MCSTEHMSESSTPENLTFYRFVEDHPEKLKFRNGTVLLSFCGNRENCWISYAQKEGEPDSFLELMRAPTMSQWAAKRFEGFGVITGSPADAIMRALVQVGGAEVLKPGERGRLPRHGRQGKYH